MAEIEISQAEADSLISMAKMRVDSVQRNFPSAGERLSVPLTSLDKREHFELDIRRSQIKLTQSTHQNRTRQAIILMRLDIDGPPHRNPDGEEVPCPHLHTYREGYGDKWAFPAPLDRYADTSDVFATFNAFMTHCNIVDAPFFIVGLF